MEKAPDAFRTISEAAEELDVPQHVLRFWETRFSQVRPMKRAGGRRYYRPQDIDLLRGIRRLLYDEGYTIKGVQKILREHGIAHVIAIGRGEVEMTHPAGMPTASPAVQTPPGAAAGERSDGQARGQVAGAGAGSGNVARLGTARGKAAADGAGDRQAAPDGVRQEDLRAVLEELEQARALLQDVVRGHEALDERLAAIGPSGKDGLTELPDSVRTSAARRG